MAINVSVQYSGGFLPDMIDTVDLMLLPSGNLIKCHQERFCLGIHSLLPGIMLFAPCLGDNTQKA